MNILTNIPAHLTYTLISFDRPSFLCLPICSSFLLGRPIQILRMVFSYSVLISTKTRAVFPCSNTIYHSTFRQEKVPATSKASTLNLVSSWCKFLRFVLALRGTVFSSAVLDSGRNHIKQFSTVITDSLDSFFHIHSIGHFWDGVNG